MSKVHTPLNPAKIPEKFHYLIPLAEKWCEMEEGELIHMLDAASKEEVEALRSAVRPIAKDLNIWLASNDAPATSDEFMAFSTLGIAVDLSDYHPRRGTKQRRD